MDRKTHGKSMMTQRYRNGFGKQEFIKNRMPIY